jgi:hypothetical protein
MGKESPPGGWGRRGEVLVNSSTTPLALSHSSRQVKPSCQPHDAIARRTGNGFDLDRRIAALAAALPPRPHSRGWP